jgi:hypothetical protein
LLFLVPKETMKESENTKNSSNAIGKTLTVIAILQYKISFARL